MNTFTSWDSELMHYGILGMKWGVRRFQNPDGTRTPAGQKRRARLEKAEKPKPVYEKKKVKYMTDDELKTRINRLKLEKEYHQLNKSPLLSTAKDVFSALNEYREKKDARQRENEKLALQRESYKTQQLQSRFGVKKAKFEAKKSATDLSTTRLSYKKEKRAASIRFALRKALAAKIGKEGLTDPSMIKGQQEADKMSLDLKLKNLKAKLDGLEEVQKNYKPKHAKKD